MLLRLDFTEQVQTAPGTSRVNTDALLFGFDNQLTNQSTKISINQSTINNQSTNQRRRKNGK